MSVRRLKSSKPEIQKKEDDIKVKTMVETTLQDVEKRGDNAVRELSLKFDKYNPQSFLLSESEIEAAIQKVSTREMNDIKFAQEQIRKFANEQLKSLKDIEVKITKLAQGLPIGGEIENLDDGTLISAFKNRSKLNINST